MGTIFLFVILFVYGFAVILMGCVALKNKKYKNKVHFYVARDMDSSIYLYLGMPHRGKNAFHLNCDCEFILASEREFKKFNLNVDNFKELRWEDEPVEVFINMDD